MAAVVAAVALAVLEEAEDEVVLADVVVDHSEVVEVVVLGDLIIVIGAIRVVRIFLWDRCLGVHADDAIMVVLTTAVEAVDLVVSVRLLLLLSLWL